MSDTDTSTDTEPKLPDLDELRDIPGWESRYAVNRRGRIWSKLEDCWLILPRNRQGYRQAYLRHRRGGTIIIRLVHNLVAAAFLGPMPEGHRAVHKDGNKFNNRASNLRYIPRVGSSTLTAEEVRDIRWKYTLGRATKRRLAADYHVSEWAIRDIINRKTWKHID